MQLFTLHDELFGLQLDVLETCTEKGFEWVEKRIELLNRNFAISVGS